MTPSPYRIVDILAVVAVALAWSHEVRAVDCSKAVPIMNHPAENMAKAQMRGTQKCEADEKRKGAAHRKSVQVLCKESADALNLPRAKRDEQYAACLRGHYPK